MQQRVGDCVCTLSAQTVKYLKLNSIYHFRPALTCPQHRKWHSRLTLAIGSLLWLVTPCAHGGITFTNLVTFVGTNGSFPSAALAQGNDGNFYGTTQNGGQQGQGTVFQMTPDGTLHTFVSFNGTNGGNPYAVLLQGADGDLYGTTEGGGTNGGYGTVFRMTTNGTLTSLFSFAGTNGAQPTAGLVQGSDGSFYGTTRRGGASGNWGTVFKITTDGALTNLVSFDGTNGLIPRALVWARMEICMVRQKAAGRTIQLQLPALYSD
jgi:uncharacterized repeat protein (TIGR03803 family)